MPDHDEAQLVARCRAGDEHAFRELVEQHKNLVFGLIARAVPDRSQVEDLAQEVFLRVHRGLPYFRGEARIGTWLYRIVLNVVAQARSRQPREQPMTRQDAEGERTVYEPGAEEPAYQTLLLRDRLDKAIARLPPEYAVLVAGHYLHGQRYEDLAAALDVPLGTVKTHLYRAKRLLREMLTTDLT
jgi:RNA polymerase sigma-70 factor (ECF subfamily)